MRKIPDLLGNEVSAKTSKAVTDALWQTGNGVSAYYLGGKIFAGCGIGWLLLSFIPIACKNPISDCIWMWILAAVQIALGILLVILSKKSKRFQVWADKDFQKALKICGIFIVIIIVLLGIGYLQGWVI